MPGIDPKGVTTGATSRLAAVRRDLAAGLSVAWLSLPICLATGLLLYAPFGPAYYGAGIAASLYGFLVGGAVAALAGRSSFLVSSPRASTALVQASMLGAAGAPLLQDPVLVVAATAACVLLAGLWQIALGALGLARVIKFTPHPVLAGFINGVALLIVVSQAKAFIDRPLALAFMGALAAFVVWIGGRSRRIPGGLAGLVLGVALFYAAARHAPALDLGPLLGSFVLPLPPRPPLADLLDPGARAGLAALIGPLMLTSLALALVATLESLLSFRAAAALAPGTLHPARDLFAQGIGNCASAAVGGMAITASPLQSTAGYRAGGRSRLVALSAIAVIGAAVLAAPAALAAVPVVVLSGLLLATAALLVDRWSLRLLGDTLGAPPSARRRRAWGDLGIVMVVMVLTALVSVVAGIIAGVLLAGLIFVLNMSRPVIRRERAGDSVSSKRMRANADALHLRATGARRRVLELEGVLFFGNADDLSEALRDRFSRCDMILLDLRWISDVDATGANILRGTVDGARRSGRRLLFCNVPPAHARLFDELAAGGGARPFPDLDTALEWMEDQELAASASRRGTAGALSLWEHPVLEGLAPAEREALRPHLIPRRFAGGEALCAEGDRADRMWLLVRGSVSVRVRAAAGDGSIRVSSCAAGTAVGEMALLQFGARSASVSADEEVEAFELTRDSFDWLCAARPRAAASLLRNLAVELAHRLRDRTEDLRHALI